MDPRELLRNRLAETERRIAAACVRAGRLRSDVTLIAVTKTVSAAVARLLPEFGIADLGENRPQALWEKASALPATVRWHLIGHLQRNKIDRTLPLTTLFHSVDSVRLAEALSKEALEQGRPADVLLEINVSGEASKQGFDPSGAGAAAAEISRLPSLRLRGLMTMAPYCEDPQQCRPVFAGLRRLLDAVRPQLPAPDAFRELSMGMTNDFEVAIEEGATFVRIGTALFEGIES